MGRRGPQVIEKEGVRYRQRKVIFLVPEKECENCGNFFFPSIVSTGGQTRVGICVSTRKTCSNECREQLRGDKIWGVHQKVKGENPEKYKQWMHREGFSETGAKAIKEKRLERGKANPNACADCFHSPVTHGIRRGMKEAPGVQGGKYPCKCKCTCAAFRPKHAETLA